MANVERSNQVLWSPHKAALKRRRGAGGKPKIDFDKLIDDAAGLNLDDSPEKGSHVAEMKAKKDMKALMSEEAAEVATTKAHKRLSAETAAMFAKLNNKNLPLD